MSSELISQIKNKLVLIFDFDGTLADSYLLFIDVMRDIAKKYNMDELSDENIQALRGKSARDVISALKIPKYRLPFIYGEGKKQFLSKFETVSLFSGMKDVLEKLDKEYTLGIVTSNEVSTVEKLLKRSNLSVFDFIYSDKSLFGKGVILKRLLKKYGFTPQQVVYVGDEVRDIDAARQAGIRFIGVTWGFNSEEILRKNNPDFLINNPSELLSVTKQLKRD